MKASDFVHLHCHSTYSLLEGLPSPEEIAAAEAERKQRESDAAKEKGPVKTIIVDARVAKTSFGGGGGDGGDGGGDGGVGGEEGV